MTIGKAIWRLADMALLTLLLAAVLSQSAQAEGGGMESNSAPAQVSKRSALAVVADASSTSPPLRFTHLTTDNGLSQNRVFAILQDRQGFMWFATRDGLNRYDGNSFVVFKNNPGDPASLSSSFILALLEDDQGCLWVGTYGGGVNRFDPATGRFTRYRHDPQNTNSLSSDIVKCITRDRRGNLWFGGDTGLSRFDPATQTFTRYRNDNAGQSVGMVNAIIEDGQGDIWFVGSAGLNRLNLRTGQIARAPASSGVINGATGLRQDKAGNLWVLASHPIFGLVKYDPQAERFTSYPADAGNVCFDISDLLEDGENGFWMSSNWGLYYFDRQKERFTRRFQHNESNPGSLSDSRIISLYRDRAGLLWVGTVDFGLNILNFQQEQFGCYRHDPKDTNSLSPGLIPAVHPDPEGIVWVGLRYRTLDRLDRKTGQVTHYVLGPDNKNTLNQSDTLADMCRDTQGYLWLGGSGASSGLDRFDERTGQFKHYRHDPKDTNSLMSDFVLAVYEDRSGNLWVGQYGGFSRLDPATERFTHYRPDPSAPTAVINNVYAIYQDRSGALWLGTLGGMLSRFDAKTETFVNHKPDSRDPHQLNGGLINAIHEDRAGTLWVGAEDGLYRYDRKNETFTRYTEHQGLPGSAVIGILEDQAGRLWLGTKSGLSRFDPQTETFRNYDTSDGLLNNDFIKGACKQGLNGEMFFGGIHGFNAFFPEKIRDNPYVPPVVLTDFQLFNKPVAIGKDAPLKKAINVADQITLRYAQNVFRLRFAALSFAQPQKNRYAYKLEGFDDDWRSTDAGDCSATYTRLAPGGYTFRVKASNNNGVWNEQGTSIKITVIPPWWLTWWFRSAAATGLLGLVFTTYRLRVRQLRQKQRALIQARDELEAEVRSRTAELAQSNIELSYEQALLRTMLDNASDHIYFKDAHSRFVRCSLSLCAHSGLAHEQMVGKTDFDIFQGEHARAAFDDEQRIIATGQPLIGKLEKEVHPDGRITWVLTTKMPWPDAEGKIIGTFGISRDITSIKDAEARLVEVHQQLVDASRKAGQAEVATGVLHNVGNVLNSVNVSTTLLTNRIRKSKGRFVGRTAEMMQQHAQAIGEFMTNDPKGQRLPSYLAELSETLQQEQAEALRELECLRKNVDHIRDIVSMQQSYAKVGGVIEKIDVTGLVEDALRINAAALSRHRVELAREFDPDLPVIDSDRHQILQVFINLLSNAKYACDDSPEPDRRIIVRVARSGNSVKVSVIDNGVGIAPENLDRVFNHGFTTRKDGHGFGLHSGALAAKELGGSLIVHSDGIGKGATFTLELPV